MSTMKTRPIVVAAIAAWTFAALPQAAAPPGIPAAGRAAIAAFIHHAVDAKQTPAVVVVVVNREQQLFLGAAGKRDVAKNADLTADAIFRIASMTKPITSLAVMMLHDEGKIGFDDPLTTYLPEWSGARVITSFNAADRTFQSRLPARPITIRHLLTHTSGIGYSFVDARLAALDDGKKSPLELPLLHDPGEAFTYGSSTAVLGLVVEKVSGQTLDAFLKARIFDPLGMRDTFFVVPPDKRGRVVTQHARTADGTTERPNPEAPQSNVRGDGGLFSTAGDYARFMQLFLNGGRVGASRLISEDSLRLMTSNQIGALRVREQPSANPALARPFPFGAGKDTFGFGFQIEAAAGKHADTGLRSEGSLSWGGINNTHFWIDPKQQIAAAVLMQLVPYYDAAAIDVLRGVERLVYQHLRMQS